MSRTLAVVRNNKDLLRIIPFKRKEESIDLKISLLKNEYNVYFSSFDETKSVISDGEITYHSSKPTEGKSSIIHIKNLEKEKTKKYEFSFKKIIDAKIDTEFPIPIFKMEINELSDRVYNRKDKHITYNLKRLDEYFSEKVNVIEFYLARQKFDYNRFSQKWPNISVLSTISSIEYLTEGFKPSIEIMNVIFNSKNPIPLETGLSFDRFKVLCKSYPNKDVKENRIIFYENKDYINLLAVVPVQLEYPDGNLSRKISAYKRDLRWQRKKGFNIEKIAQWNTIFKPALERIKDTKLDRYGVIFPQVR